MEAIVDKLRLKKSLDVEPLDQNVPISYSENNQKEIEILRLADSYQSQFRFLYPRRLIPYLYLENECGVNKLVCTSLCPFKITKTNEMREWKDCANFLADYIQYVPLDIPTQCPKKLVSLDRILKNRKGNSLEMSMVLCSFLLSSDFDAYVVQGYATEKVTKKIEKNKPAPEFLLPKKFRIYEKYFDESSKTSSKPRNKYYVNFAKAKEFWIEGKVAEEPEEVKQVIKEREEMKDILFGKRVHFWVLIRSYDEGVLNSTFVEASTGETISLDNPEYLGIEFLWNDKNFWSNNQQVGIGCKNLEFEFDDYNKWEAFLPEHNIKGRILGDGTSEIRVPETWLRGIEILEEDVENRFPPEGKTTQYKTAKVEKYNPHTLKDGLVCRLINYDPQNLGNPLKSYSFYSDRKDRLEYRVIDIKKETVTERFGNEREDALKLHEYHLYNDPNFFQTMEFHSYLRKDQLSSRKWTERMIIDKFTDRSDFLCSREVIYQTDSIPEKDQQINKDNQVLKTEDANDKITEAKEKDDNEGESASTSENKESRKEIIVPASFNSLEPILEDLDFSIWTFQQFLERIDPAERYATSESESDEQKSESEVYENEKQGVEDSTQIRRGDREVSHNEDKDKLPVDDNKSKDEDKKRGTEDITQMRKGHREVLDNEDKDQLPVEDESKSEDADDEEQGTEESTKIRRRDHRVLDNEDKDKLSAEDDHQSEEASIISEQTTNEKDPEREFELEIYDEINFDNLSDEELEVDYEIFLSKIWDEYSQLKNINLFFIDREFQSRKDMRKKEILAIKKKIMRKRRVNVRFMQRKETGKPQVRVHKKKADENLEEKQGYHTNALIKHLSLNEKLGISEASQLKEFHYMDLEKDLVDTAKAEMIQKESMKILDKKLKETAETEKLLSGKRILSIQNSYSKDPSIPLENSIRNIWYLFESNAYLIDFHCPEGKSMCRTLIFTKPESGSTEFTYSDYLCRQIIPIYERQRISRPRLYSLLVALIKKESLVLRENKVFENEMKKLLAERREEMEMISSFKERSGWKKAVTEVLQIKNCDTI
ncbi:dynein regulatory complex subunit 7 [Trichonephila clavata]|uniref:Dynein regulatory complex subunit 7 n=1 Tax=Trichonephila clavata TaxID=2740835 RepID=A0A8X6J1G9_TRICU|nr:dynein regulatory complex subunit 7 [Trichonephila clavata]